MAKGLKGKSKAKSRKPRKPVVHTLGWWILKALRTGKSITIPAADVEAARQRYTESVSPKIDEIRKRQRPASGMEHLRLD